jgi:hypothetical protein
MSLDFIAYARPGIAEMFIIFMLFMGIIMGSIIPVISFWKICSKAGFPAPLGLLMLVPIANIILPLYVAFAQWPATAEDIFDEC